MKTTPNNENALVSELHFGWGGGYVFPETKLRKIPGVTGVHSYVSEGTATVWITWEHMAVED